MLPVGYMETLIFSPRVNFYLMKIIFLYIRLNFYRGWNFHLQGEFSFVGRIFTLQAPIFIVIAEVWPVLIRPWSQIILP